jgi:hypothetical protein
MKSAIVTGSTRSAWDLQRVYEALFDPSPVPPAHEGARSLEIRRGLVIGQPSVGDDNGAIVRQDHAIDIDHPVPLDIDSTVQGLGNGARACLKGS